MIGGLIDDVMRAVGDARDGAAEAFLEPTLRLGVTGLSRAGKTVFITSLVGNMLERGRMTKLSAHAQGRISAVALRPQPDRDVPRFDYETHMQALFGREPRWPSSTRAIGQLRLSIRYRPGGLLDRMAGLLTGTSTLHLDIVDYPGEWLLDLPLMGMDFAEWSRRTLALAETPMRCDLAAGWRDATAAADPDAPHDEGAAQGLGRSYTAYLAACRKAGLSGMTPGRFLMPGDLEGSPALTFAPLPPGEGRRGSLRREFARRFDAYKSAVVRPFFRDHFARLDRQVVLVDLLGALDAGPGAVADLRGTLADVLACFRPGANSWLAPILGRRVDRMLIAATKADHIHHTQHPQMSAILAGLLRESVERARFRGARVEAMAVASLRSTVEQEVVRDGRALPCVRGRLLETGRQAALFAGDLPSDPQAVLAEAREDAGRDAGWLGGDLDVMDFAPPGAGGRPGDGPPHIRLDQAAEFLLGDRLA